MEWLNNKPDYKDRVYAFGAWDCLPAIVNAERSTIHTNGEGAIFPVPATEAQRAINEINDNLPRYWNGSERFDAVIMPAALECLLAAAARAVGHARRNGRMGTWPPL